MKERDTVIIAIRIKKALSKEVKQRIGNRKVSRNSWLIWTIKEGLRSHKKKG